MNQNYDYATHLATSADPISASGRRRLIATASVTLATMMATSAVVIIAALQLR